MYETNMRLPRLRMIAVRRVRSGCGIRAVARHLGYTPGAVSKWMRRADHCPSNASLIPTLSSRPHHHPHELSDDVVLRILALRQERSQCAEILHHRLQAEGITVSLSSVKRTLSRHGVRRFSKNKKWHQYPERPAADKPGILVQIDSVHEGIPSLSLSAYALIDVHSRWGYAEPTLRSTGPASLRFVQHARTSAPFPFATIQSDHGSEFGRWFTTMLEHGGTSHRHARVRTPTDNAHVERFIQTLQRECLHRIPRTWRSWQKEIPGYLYYYNTERPHMALAMKTPADILKVFPRY